MEIKAGEGYRYASTKVNTKLKSVMKEISDPELEQSQTNLILEGDSIEELTLLLFF